MKVIFPDMVEGQTDWRLYSEYQVPVGRDPWPTRDRIIFRVLMFFHACVDKAWRLIWKAAQRTWKIMMFWNDGTGNLRQWVWSLAQPFKQPPMKYETKYHEIKVLEKDGSNVVVDNTEHLINGAPVFSERPK